MGAMTAGRARALIRELAIVAYLGAVQRQDTPKEAWREKACRND